MQRQIFNSDHGLLGKFASRFGAVPAIAGLLLLSACGGGGSKVTDNNLAEPSFKDGVPPTLTSVSIRESTKSAKPNGFVKPGKAVRVDIGASEALMKPRVTINGVEAEEVGGKVNAWYAILNMPEAPEAEELGEVTFEIVYQDISGELGDPVSATSDGSSLIFCDDDVIKCPEPVNLAGDWRMEYAGVGPAAGDGNWWNSDIEGVLEARACLFDDIYRMADGGTGTSGVFQNIPGDETWLEAWQGTDPEACGTPVAPHDGSSAGTWEFDEAAGTLTVSGTGSFLGLAKAVNAGELPNVAVPDSIVYEVLTLEADSMTVAIEAGSGVWWTFRFGRQPLSPLAGKWKLDTVGGAGVGPAAGDLSWWSTDADGVVEARACWFDDIFEFGADGSFHNMQGEETWLEAWQGSDPEACGAPVAPHDGSNGAIYQYDEDAGTLKLTGRGAHLGLPKAVNAGELPNVPIPESVIYDVLTLDGDSMTVAVEAGEGVWWTFKLVRISNSPVVGKWKLALVGGAGVGPAAGDLSWWSTDADGVVEARACWFDDIYHLGADGSFQNYQGGETWLEAWQGSDPEACGAPVAPHDGANTGSFTYDADAGTLTIDGRGSFLGLPKAVNAGELPNVAIPDSVIYDVLTLEADSMTVAVEAGDGVWWTFKLERVADTAALAGKWILTHGPDPGYPGAGVGPVAGDVSWWNSDPAWPERACWFDDVFDFGADGSFMNDLGDETWIEEFQGGAPNCGAPVAPHDGSARAIFEYDDAAGTLKISGTGAYLGIPKAVNGGELPNVPVPDDITYNVLALDGDTMRVAVESGAGVWWNFSLVRVSNSPLVGNWKLNTTGGAGVGPSAGDLSWWSTDIDGVVEARACLFDDVFHFGAGANFQNFQDGETWLEAWQGTDPEACGTPVAPHDGSSAGSYGSPTGIGFDEDSGKLSIYGRGSHLGLAKAVNGGELPNVAIPDYVVYDVLSFEPGSMTVTVEAGDGVWWTFSLIKE